MNPYRALFQTLNVAKIRYLVVGGVAVNLHGHRRFTADVDILLALDPKNLQAMAEIMHEMGYTERLPVELQELGDEKKVKQFLEEKGMMAYTFLSGSRERIDVDILAPDSISFDSYDKNKVFLNIDDDINVPVISVSDLIAMKKNANRQKDVDDVAALLELKGL
jgi:predicted nucleotidyltransferase